MQVTLAYHLWLKLGNGGKLPHDARNISGEALYWYCPWCNREGGGDTECDVDWRWSLHELRYVEALEEVGIDPYQIVQQEDTMEI